MTRFSYSRLTTFGAALLTCSLAACLAPVDDDESYASVSLQTTVSVDPERQLGFEMCAGDCVECGENRSELSVLQLEDPPNHGNEDIDSVGGWARNKKNSCVPAADANAKKEAGLTFEGGKTAEEAAEEIQQCVDQAGCWDEIFKPTKKGQTWEDCFDALCECNDAIVEENLDCSDPFRRIGGRNGGSQDACLGHDGALLIFHSADRTTAHVVSLVRTEDAGEDGTIYEVRDPNEPTYSNPVLVDESGTVTESFVGSVPPGAKLSGCYSINEQD